MLTRSECRKVISWAKKALKPRHKKINFYCKGITFLDVYEDEVIYVILQCEIEMFLYGGIYV